MADVLVGAKEVAEMLGISRQRVNKIAQTDSDFPQAVGTLAAGRIWREKDIVGWAKRSGRRLYRRGGQR
jgi:predicted DNA-binding transcriptional regulator AlpA